MRLFAKYVRPSEAQPEVLQVCNLEFPSGVELEVDPVHFSKLRHLPPFTLRFAEGEPQCPLLSGGKLVQGATIIGPVPAVVAADLPLAQQSEPKPEPKPEPKHESKSPFVRGR